MDELFVDLRPPPGGLEDLRARVERRRGIRWWIPLGSALAAAAVVLAIAWPRPTDFEGRLTAALEPLDGQIRLTGEGSLEPVVETDSMVMVRWRP